MEEQVRDQSKSLWFQLSILFKGDSPYLKRSKGAHIGYFYIEKKETESTSALEQIRKMSLRFRREC